jgi:uncharacterized metal-binding protein
MIDGCPLECGAHTLRRSGITGFQQLRLHELGIRKNAGEAREATVQALADAATILLSGAGR